MSFFNKIKIKKKDDFKNNDLEDLNKVIFDYKNLKKDEYHKLKEK